ncbi:hypothetical protein ABZ027_40715 [Streptomyces sp. NPDC006332]|uniref:hypothetical protein n=1 Tax=Streptomyces sp. NPDC006332 TaxID=3155456 RepID=UPI0033A18302
MRRHEGDRTAALLSLRPYAELLASASQVIREGVADPGFLQDCVPWLNALTLWGAALTTCLDALERRPAGAALDTGPPWSYDHETQKVPAENQPAPMCLCVRGGT